VRPATSSRRRLLAAIAGLPIVHASAALADAVALAIGGDTESDGAPLVAAMQGDELVTKAAEELRLSLELRFIDAPVATQMLQALLTGGIQIGTLDSTPLIRMLGSGNPPVPIALAGGGMNFPLMVPPNSPIHDLPGLQGTTVLTAVGADPHLVLARMLQAEFGHDDLQRLRITLRPIASIAELGRAPSGADTVMGVQPLGYAAERRGLLVTLLLNDGVTGPAWKGPEGDGAGHRARSFAKTPLAPEAYYPQRQWWVVRQDFLRANQDVVVAFLSANARAAAALGAAPAAKVIQVGGEQWAGEISDQERFVQRILWHRRGWAWITEGDVRTLVVLSGTKSLFEKELTADDMLRILKPAAPLTRKAWILAGARPALAAFTDPDADDIRGPPMWEIDKWKL
jgi:ABC-type nitrate/sulfonate/bicarbonate transport system substrate-binding protein